jgi:uncharacterized delta-60 repeat protein
MSVRHPRPRARSLALAAALAALLAVPAWLALRALAAPGDPVRGFGGDGLAQLGPDTQLSGAAVQGDGKLVAVGTRGADADAARLLVVRFNPNGALDRSFSGDGIATLGAASVGHGLVVQSNGRIVAAGTATDPSGRYPNGMLAARLNPNGSLDRSFSGDGVAAVFEGQVAEARAVALVGSKVLLAGSAPIGGVGFPRLALARLNANGSPDGSFGSGGTALHDFGRLTVANDVALSGGKIVVAGSQRDNLQTTNVLAARFNANGSPDPSFVGNSGIPGLFVQQYARAAGYSAAHGVALQGNKLVLAGNATNGVDPDNGADALAIRLNPNGTPDGSFSGDGVVYLPATTHRDQYTSQPPLPGAHAVVLSGNAIVLGGYFDDLGKRRPALWALGRRGSPLGSFGQGGRVVTPTGEVDFAELLDLVGAPDGSLFGVGDTVRAIAAPRGLAANYAGFGGAPARARCLGKAATIVGTKGRDVLRGTGRRDVIAGLGNVDRIIARGGNDLVCGGGGNDKIYLHGGRDKASGGAGADLLAGGPGNDTLLGNAGRDRLLGAAGNDRLFGGAANDVVLGGKGRDFLRGGAGKDRVVGGAGKNNVRQ